MREPTTRIKSELQKLGILVARQSVRVRCERAPSEHCSFEMTLVLDASSVAVDISKAEWTGRFPSTWAWRVAEPGVFAVRGEVVFGKDVPGPECGGDAPAAIVFRHLLLFMRYRPGRNVWSIPALSTTPPEVTLEAGELSSSADNSSIVVERSMREAVLTNSGPYVGNGVSFLGRGRSDYKLRVGYEFARPSWLVYSLSAETDFRSLTVVPVMELAPSLWSPSLGVGVPVRAFDRPAIGIRGQVAIHVPLFGLVVAVDAFPGLPEGERWVASIYGQLTL